MKPIFKPENFKTYYTTHEESQQLMADIANDIVNKVIESSLTVYGTMNDNGFMGSHPYLTGPLSKDTHKAKLMCIEALLKEECKHENKIIYTGGGTIITHISGKCMDCGNELQVTWSEKK